MNKLHHLSHNFKLMKFNNVRARLVMIFGNIFNFFFDIYSFCGLLIGLGHSYKNIRKLVIFGCEQTTSVLIEISLPFY